MMNRKMAPDELKGNVMEFLQEHREGSLATCMNNRPRTSPVQYFVGKDMNIYILSAGGDKFKAINENPNVCLLVNTEYINYRQIKGVQVFGKATTSVTNDGVFDEAKMYHPDPYIMEHEGDNIKVIKIIPEEIVYLDSIGDGNRTKQVLKNNEVLLREDQIMSIH